MSSTAKSLLTVTLLLLLAASAFVAGYFTNDFVELMSGEGTLVRERQDFDLFWEAWDRIETNFIGELPTSQAFTYGAIRGVVGLLDDPYTVFIEPAIRDQERESLRGTFGGIGAYIRRPEEGGDMVLEPIPGNPAELAGVLFGDVLIAIDETPVTPEMTVQEVADLVRGEKGTTVTLTVIHPGESDSVDIDVVRDDILIPSVTYRMLDTETPIGYIQLTRFSGESGNEIYNAIVDLTDQGAQKLVLDLRGNGGGLLDAAVSVADHFMDEGVVVYQESRTEGEKVRETTNETIAPDVPLVILVDGGTASASEILAGALQDRERATIIGQKTFGKGSVQLVFDLSDGSSVHVTSARWLTPDKHQIDQQGLEPDIVVEITQDAIDNGRDDVLNQAVEFLQQLP
ncbi:MAG: S41 family peptidase [Ardenticatenaceae bacterium]|nr:S41 family peptidase [Ardenticatenaceae bacterium]